MMVRHFLQQRRPGCAVTARERENKCQEKVSINHLNRFLNSLPPLFVSPTSVSVLLYPLVFVSPTLNQKGEVYIGTIGQ